MSNEIDFEVLQKVVEGIQEGEAAFVTIMDKEIVISCIQEDKNNCRCRVKTHLRQDPLH